MAAGARGGGRGGGGGGVWGQMEGVGWQGLARGQGGPGRVCALLLGVGAAATTLGAGRKG